MKKNLTLIVAVILVATMIAGVSYAHWFETIYISGEVQMGTMDVVWIDCLTNDMEWMDDPGLKVTSTFKYEGGHIDEYALTGDYVDYGKDIAETNCVVCGDVDEIFFDIAYPSYAPMVSLWVENGGTVPAHLEAYEFKYNDVASPSASILLDNDGGLELIGWWVTYDDDVIYGVTKGTYSNLPYPVTETNQGVWCMPKLMAYLMGSDDMPGVPGDYEGIQIHPGEAFDVHLLFHFQNHMDQNDQYTFDIDFTWINWNEDANNPLAGP